MRWIFVGFCALAACDEPTPYVQRTCTSSGARSELTLDVDGGARPSIEEPIACIDGSSYVVRVRGFGRRPLDRGQPNKRHDPDDPCEQPATSPRPGGCPAVAFGAFADVVTQALFLRFGPERLFGHDGTCNAEVGTRTLASGVPMLRYWSNADEAVRMVDEELERYDIRDDFPIVVQGDTCKRLN